MKLRIYSKENSDTLRRGKPIVRINSKSGSISFNPFACTALSLEEGMGLLVLQDKDRPQDWYVMKSNSEDAFKLRSRENSNKYGGTVHNKALSAAMLRSVNASTTSASFLVATEPVIYDGKELYAIITKSIKE